MLHSRSMHKLTSMSSKESTSGFSCSVDKQKKIKKSVCCIIDSILMLYAQFKKYQSNKG